MLWKGSFALRRMTSIKLVLARNKQFFTSVLLRRLIFWHLVTIVKRNQRIMLFLFIILPMLWQTCRDLIVFTHYFDNCLIWMVILSFQTQLCFHLFTFIILIGAIVLNGALLIWLRCHSCNSAWLLIQLTRITSLNKQLFSFWWDVYQCIHVNIICFYWI